MEGILTVREDERFPIDGRELHRKLGVETKYADWFPRMCEFGFVEGEDFFSILRKNPEGGRPRVEHTMSLSMAKEICMLQRTEKGREIRRYLISVEEAWNSPEQIMSRALKMAEAQIKRLSLQIAGLEADKSLLAVEKQIMQPKADYFDDMVERNLLTSVRDTAIVLQIKEKAFVQFLIEHKYLFRDKKGKLMPCAGKEDLFEAKESLNQKTGWGGVQTLITPKGRETFRLLTEGMRDGRNH